MSILKAYRAWRIKRLRVELSGVVSSLEWYEFMFNNADMIPYQVIRKIGGLHDRSGRLECKINFMELDNARAKQ